MARLWAPPATLSSFSLYLVIQKVKVVRNWNASGVEGEKNGLPLASFGEIYLKVVMGNSKPFRQYTVPGSQSHLPTHSVAATMHPESVGLPLVVWDLSRPRREEEEEEEEKKEGVMACNCLRLRATTHSHQPL
ncbi:hypothetical protein E2C01_013878 [Portunus trituberculatus]|uniref:Uncharacterized protein n=1 Tax=Portunus trituberculatus TaxID=210409 RepID=A0A5B7DIG9_PORTR|nr:hypothetical protein [Portunus trituberculatus]